MKAILALWAGLTASVGLTTSEESPVTGLSVVPNLERTEIIISVEGNLEYRDFTMEGPSRLVVDFLDATHGLPEESYPGINRGGVRAIRASQYSEDIVRIVVELESMVDYNLLEGEGFLRVSLDNSGETFEPWEVIAPPAALRDLLVRSPANDAPSRQQEADRISISFTNTPISEVLFTFAEFADRSIIPGADVATTLVTAEVRDQPWDLALREIVESYGFVATESDAGIIRIQSVSNLNELEQIETLVTRAYPISYGTAEEYEQAIGTLLTERGEVSVGQGRNAVIVTDIQRVHDATGELIAELDVRTPQVSIKAEIIFVNRTDLNEFGVTYDLKDSQGNQLNLLTPGLADLDGDGVLDQVDQGTNVISLGGNSISALGNATQRVAGPSLTLLTSLVVGRHTLVSFIDALESVNMSEVQAHPSVRVTNNKTARVLVGERTPLRVIDVSATGAGGGGEQGGGLALPQATVELQETGIILDATPHVTAGDNILLEIRAERSAAELAPSDVGFIFRTQEAESQVLVQDGETIAIAGLTVVEKTESRSGIPLMMDLPVVGRLFQVNREQTIQRDLMILITPTIVRPGQG